MKDAVKITNLTVHYHAVPVLWDINAVIPRGVMLAILGPNGAGKSTLLRAVLELVQPMSGTVQVMGKKFDTVRSLCAYVPQREAIDWDFPITVRELVLMGRYPHLGPFGWTTKQDREAVESCLEKVGLHDLAGRQISELSGGQQQRAFLARALLQDPDIYFLDEPLAGVDHASEELMLQILKDAVKRGKTVLMVHHDLNSVQKIFSWVLLLNVRLVTCGPTETHFSKQHIKQAYGKNFALFDETLKLSQIKHAGM